MHTRTEDGGARLAERMPDGPLHESYDTPADAGLIRAVATDIEDPESGYVLGGITSSRLRKLADTLDNPIVKAILGAVHGRGCADIELRFVEKPSGTVPAITLGEGTTLLSVLVAAGCTGGVS